MIGEPSPLPSTEPRASFLGVPVEFHRSLGSTNDEALRRAAEEEAPEGLVVVTDEQTAGRGRQGRTWWDRPGESLLFSVLLRPDLPLARFPLFGIAMACAVAEVAGEAARAPLAVKWPNDVLHEGKKVCGVLAESRSSGTGSSYVVIGAGINVNQDAASFPIEIRDRATSLRLAARGRAIDRHALLAALLACLDAYRRIALDQGADALYASVRPWLPPAGAAIAIQTGDRRIVGTVEDVLETGALLVRDAEGARVVVAAGEIPFHLGSAPA
jgi:BirA family biotin operon repressor/biotin-[acetyl-CoA-carboxylase] ligase